MKKDKKVGYFINMIKDDAEMKVHVVYIASLCDEYVKLHNEDVHLETRYQQNCDRINYIRREKYQISNCITSSISLINFYISSIIHGVNLKDLTVIELCQYFSSVRIEFPTKGYQMLMCDNISYDIIKGILKDVDDYDNSSHVFDDLLNIAVNIITRPADAQYKKDTMSKFTHKLNVINNIICSNTGKVLISSLNEDMDGVIGRIYDLGPGL